MSKREIDANGYITVKRNPISKVGVFPYLGKNISSSLEPNKIYWVLRPAEELGHPDTIESFKMVPIIEDHTMLGKGATPAEVKGVEGTTGQQVELDGDILYSDIRIFSDSMKEKLNGGKTELSMGYRVGEWEPASGTFNGQMYDFIQRKIRGNHIALVDEGRMGKEVAVLDHSCVYDHMEIDMTADAKEKGFAVYTDKPDGTHNIYRENGQYRLFATKGKAAAKAVELWKKAKAGEKVGVEEMYAEKGGPKVYDEDLTEDADDYSKVRALYKRAIDLNKQVTRLQLDLEKAELELRKLRPSDPQYREARIKVMKLEAEEDKVDLQREKVEREYNQAEKAYQKRQASLRDIKDTASDETASPAADNKTDADTTKGTDMADEEKKGLSMDEVKEFIKGHAKDRKTFDKLMDSMRPAEDADEEKAEDAKEDEKAEDADEDKKAEDADEEKAKKALDADLAEDEDDKKKDAQDAAIEGLRGELNAFKKNGMKTLMSEINKRNELGKEVEAAFGTFDHAEMTADEVAAYGLKKAGIKVAKGQEAAAWAGFNAGRKAARSPVGTGQVFDHKEVPKGSLIEKTLNKSK